MRTAGSLSARYRPGRHPAAESWLPREYIDAGHDQHHLFTRSDDAPDRMHGELVNITRLRLPNINAFELILGRDLLFNQFCNFPANVAQILPYFGSHILVDL